MNPSPSARHVLFLCTGNSARSILAEALVNRSGPPRWRAFSAGSHPKTTPHPAALALLSDKGYAVQAFRSKSWDEFAQTGAPRIDVVVTVCDNAAGERCPIFPGKQAKIHWGLEDPAACEGSSEAMREGFEKTYAELETRIERLFAIEREAISPTEFEEVLLRSDWKVS